jgi:hypothetical protein
MTHFAREIATLRPGRRGDAGPLTGEAGSAGDPAPRPAPRERDRPRGLAAGSALGYAAFLGSGLAAGLSTAWLIARATTRPLGLFVGAILVTTASLAAPLLVILLMFAFAGAGH